MAFNRYLIERDIPEAVDAYNACAQKAEARRKAARIYIRQVDLRGRWRERCNPYLVGRGALA